MPHPNARTAASAPERAAPSSTLASGGWFDGHLDLAYLAECGRPMERPATNPDDACATFPDLREGGVVGCLATIFTESGALGKPAGYRDSADVEAAHAAGVRQLHWYEAQERAGRIRIVRTAPELDEALAVARAGGPLAVVLLMECSDPIRSADEAAWWFERGVRVVGLSWSLGSRAAGGNRAAGALTDVGRALVRAFDELGILHDASHLSDGAFDELLRTTPKRIVASHSNCRALVDAEERHLTDAQIAAIAARDGLVGLNFFTKFLAHGRAATVDDVLRHIERVASLAGRERCALGSDLDGGFTPLDLPSGIRHPRDYRTLLDGLAARGWDADALRGFRSDNWVRVLRASLPSALPTD